MRSIVFEQFGQPDGVLQLQQSHQPVPGPGEVVVRVHARPVNPSDLIPVRGSYRHRTPLPGVPGYEGVGIVTAAARGVHTPAIGIRVLALRGAGTWQEYVRAPAACCVPVPVNLPDRLACQLYINPLTAWVILTEALHLVPGDVLLVNAGGSAFAHVLIQFARILGYRVILVTRNSLHTARLKALGAYAVLDASVCAVYPAVMYWTHSRGAAAALDAVGGEAGADLAGCVAPGGSFVHYGLLSGRALALSDTQIKNAGLQVRGFWLRSWLQRTSIERYQAVFDKILTLVSTGRVTLLEPACVYDLENVREAVRMAQRPGLAGKVVLTG